MVVPVRDRSEQLDGCLRALSGLSVIVVDDASLDSDAVAGVVARHGAGLVPLTETSDGRPTQRRPARGGHAVRRGAGLGLKRRRSMCLVALSSRPIARASPVTASSGLGLW